MQIRLPQPEIGFSPAVSRGLKIVKGQQFPWKDKPGKTAQQVQAPREPFGKFFLSLTSRQYAAQLRAAPRCFINVKYHYGLPVVAEQHEGTSPTRQCGARTAQLCLQKHFESLSSGTSLPEEGLSFKLEEKQPRAAFQASLSLCVLEMKL